MTYSANARVVTQSRFPIILLNDLAHFKTRASSWWMAFLNLFVGVVMTVNPDWAENPGAEVYLSAVLRVAPQEAWRALFLLIGFGRLVALVLNGTFREVWWTPHVRMILSGLSALVWLQFAASVWVTPHLAISSVVFPFLVIFEMWNTAVAASETNIRPGDHG